MGHLGEEFVEGLDGGLLGLVESAVEGVDEGFIASCAEVLAPVGAVVRLVLA
jgi:hypothetical protein